MTLIQLLTLMTSIALSIPQPPHSTNSINHEFGQEHEIKESLENNMSIDDILHRSKQSGVDAAQLIGLSFIIYGLATITHEWGHAIAATQLFELEGTPQIHIGDVRSATADELFSVGNMHFYKSLWMQGRTNYGDIRIHEPINLRRGAVTAAGGLCAAAMLYGLLSVISTYAHFDGNKSLISTAITGLKNGVSPFDTILTAENLSFEKKRLLLNISFIICTSIIFNIFYGCTPWLGQGDGISIWRDRMGVTGTPLTVARGISTAGAIGSFIWLFKKFYSARQTLLKQTGDNLQDLTESKA